MNLICVKVIAETKREVDIHIFYIVYIYWNFLYVQLLFNIYVTIFSGVTSSLQDIIDQFQW